MIERYIQFLGVDNTIKLLKANELPLTSTIRVNTLKIKPEDLKKKMLKKGFRLEEIEDIPYSFRITKKTFNLGSTHEFLQGYYYLQNVASMLSAIILDPNPNDTIVDMCAAPGSKATHIAQLMKNEGNLILIERNKNRIPALETNLQRMGIINSIVLNMDAIDLPKLDVRPDKILLDAPCTGEGLIRQDPSRKRSKKLRDIEKMSVIQKKLLRAGLKVLKSGGRLLYCTCSIAPEENEFVVNEVLKNLKNFTIVKIPGEYGVSGLTEVFGINLLDSLHHSQRLYPHLHDTIGFYFCLIERL
ncbi:MAG: RsmB/NOP family class I SAM-dependent RNA methyltransferase [Promethearchaeota archaeon]|jgi:NOL1/NOP2/sun family putative RNA methylase